MQNDYCHSSGALASLGHDVGSVQEAVPRIRALLDLAEAAGVPRIFVRTEHGPWFDTAAWRARGRSGTTLNLDEAPIVVAGTWGAEFYGVTPDDDDLVVVKHRYSAFAFTPLELALRARERDTVVLVGTQTNVCVEATAVDAIMRGFHPVLVEDCVATTQPDLHQQGVAKFSAFLGAVHTSADLADAWTRNGSVTDRNGEAQATASAASAATHGQQES